ncbi:hypothetical protein Bca4012_010249 [Brassica carinata]
MASGQKRSTESEKGKGLQIDSSSPSLRVIRCASNGPSAKLLGSAIRARRDAPIESIARDRAAVGAIESDRAVGSPNNIGPTDTFWRDIPKIVLLDQQKWGDFNFDRIRLDWMSNEPFVEGKGKRLGLPLMGKIPKSYSSYSHILRAELGGGSFSSFSAPEGKDVEAQTSPLETAKVDERDAEVQGSPIEEGDVEAADLLMKGSGDPTVDANPSKKKNKKKGKSSKKAVTETGGGADLAEKDQEMGDRSVDGVKGPRDSAEDGRASLLSAKRKELTDGSSLDVGEKRPKRSHDSCSRSSEEITLPASRLLPWGGSDPPSDRLVLAASERWVFHHDKDVPLVSDRGACAALMRQIRGGMHLMPEISKLAFPDSFVESARADIELCALFAGRLPRNQLISDYEVALRGMASDYARAEAMIETKDAEIEKLKKAALEKSKEIINERTRYFRERKQAKQTADDLEEELETARSKVARLEAEAETSKRTREFMRQAHRRDLVSQTSCISAAATDRLDKFRRYMADRDKREEKLILHSTAFGTLESMDVLKDLGMPIPKELIDTLAANEANFRREMEEVTVKTISEQDLVLPRFPGLEASQSLTRSDSSSGNVDPTAALAHRSPDLAGEPPATQGDPIGDRELVAAGSKGMRADVASGAASSDLVAED